MVFQFGGQTAVNLAEPLHQAGASLLGGGSESVDLAEDRRLFEDLVIRLAIPQPPGAAILTVDQALTIAHRVGYPVLVRPSFVLGGWGMEIVNNDEDLAGYVSSAEDLMPGRPILVDKYLEGREIEVDAVCDGEDVLIPGIMEHVERAGVHSGDSIAIYPASSLTEKQRDDIVEYTRRLGVGLGVRGLFNVQYVIFRDEVYVLEANPRSSPHDPVHQQGHRSPDGRPRDAGAARQEPARAGLDAAACIPRPGWSPSRRRSSRCRSCPRSTPISARR